MKTSPTSPPGTRRPNRVFRGRRGMILLEILAAMSLFGILGVALTQALHLTAKSALASQREVQMLRTLKSLLTEASKSLRLEEGEENLGEDQNGVYFQRIVEPLEVENMDGQLLNQMWRVAIVASWVTSGGREMEEVAETIRYEPLYQNNR